MSMRERSARNIASPELSAIFRVDGDLMAGPAFVRPYWKLADDAITRVLWGHCRLDAVFDGVIIQARQCRRRARGRPANQTSLWCRRKA